MKHSIKLVAVAALVVLGAVALAQGGQGGGRQGGGRFGMMGGRGGGGPASIVSIPEVQTEIGLNDDQKKKLQEFQDKQREEQRARMEEMRNSGGGGGGFDMEAMRKQQAEQQAKSEKAIKEILTEAQWKRTYEIWVQNQGNRAILNEQVQKDLALTDDQKSKIKDLQTKQQEAGQAMMEKMRNGEIQREEIQDLMTKQNQVMNDELGKILTTEQAAKLKEMGGKAFKLPERRGGGGGL